MVSHFLCDKHSVTKQQAQPWGTYPRNSLIAKKISRTGGAKSEYLKEKKKEQI